MWTGKGPSSSPKKGVWWDREKGNAIAVLQVFYMNLKSLANMACLPWFPCPCWLVPTAQWIGRIKSTPSFTTILWSEQQKLQKTGLSFPDPVAITDTVIELAYWLSCAPRLIASLVWWMHMTRHVSYWRDYLDAFWHVIASHSCIVRKHILYHPKPNFRVRGITLPCLTVCNSQSLAFEIPHAAQLPFTYVALYMFNLIESNFVHLITETDLVRLWW